MQPDNNERFLMLVRHSAVQMDKNMPSNVWSLSEIERDRFDFICQSLQSQFRSNDLLGQPQDALCSSIAHARYDLQELIMPTTTGVILAS